MIKIKPAPRPRLQPLEDGQVWHMEEMKLQVDMVGRLLVHYKLGKHNAVRIPNSIGSKTDIEKFLKKNKAVLLDKVAVVVKKPKPAPVSR